MAEEFDVIVVGAGPAGSSAAREAAELGAKVLLVEKRRVIGEPVRCAGGILAEDLPEGADDCVIGRSCKVRLVGPGGEAAEYRSPDGGPFLLFLDRKRFDQRLALKAAEAGAEVRTGVAAVGLIVEGGSVGGVVLEEEGGAREARCGVVVAADGIEAQVGRWAGVSGPFKRCELLSCAQFLVVPREPVEAVEVHVDPERFPGGYGWVAPRDDGTAVVGAGVMGGSGRRPFRAARELLEARLPGAPILETVVGAAPCAPPLERPFGEGVLVAGDAARVAEPLSGAGIANAILTGREAGRVAAEAVGRGDVSARALSAYAEATADLRRALLKAYKVRRALLPLGPSEVRRLVGIMADVLARGRPTLLGTILAALRRAPGLMLKIGRELL